MSAKKTSPQSKSEPKPTPTPTAAPAPAAAAFAATAETAASSWLESSDPRRRRIAQAALVVVWLYVAALWLLALDQWFKWGIFGP
ncbi:hypothetical protein [Opitutus sp. ER46]|uniref:hypothetical protein n=1 Tax=Opitutus sp. ER46 TaxID=2161864 RepID=UPI000D304654|nr:hypothetical protein [Opitutus sp. ER46]PTY01092.1 hypothetical protein DB354_00730 [Opitutus sp. ER46]